MYCAMISPDLTRSARIFFDKSDERTAVHGASMTYVMKSERDRAFDIYLEIIRNVAIWIREAKPRHRWDGDLCDFAEKHHVRSNRFELCPSR